MNTFFYNVYDFIIENKTKVLVSLSILVASCIFVFDYVTPEKTKAQEVTNQLSSSSENTEGSVPVSSTLLYLKYEARNGELYGIDKRGNLFLLVDEVSNIQTVKMTKELSKVYFNTSPENIWYQYDPITGKYSIINESETELVK